MWWNPINGMIKYLDSLKRKKDTNVDSKQMAELSKKRKEIVITPAFTAYWTEANTGVWKFDCACGETCSSYENHIYHPTGLMYECTNCNLWSHVRCNFGEISMKGIEAMNVIIPI